MKRRMLMALFIVTALPAAAASLSLTVELQPASALPGIPVRAVVVARNESAMPQTLPRHFVVEAHAEGADAFLPSVLPEFVVKTLPEEYLGSRVVPAGETRTFEIPLSAELTAEATGDARLWKPGTYALRLYFHDQLRNDDVGRFGLHGLLGAGRLSTPLLASTDAKLRIDEPRGVDAEIWSALLRATNGRGLVIVGDERAHAIAAELWDRAGESAYMPYLVAYMKYTPRDQFHAIWDRVLARHADHPVAETLRYARARLNALEAKSSIARGASLESVLARTEEARAELKELRRSARQALVRIRAANALAELKSRDQLTAMHRDMAPKR